MCMACCMLLPALPSILLHATPGILSTAAMCTSVLPCTLLRRAGIISCLCFSPVSNDLLAEVLASGFWVLGCLLHLGWQLNHLFSCAAGIISCLCFSPVSNDLLAAGSYSRCIGLFDGRTYEQLLLLEGHKGGVTQVRCSCSDISVDTGMSRGGPHVLEGKLAYLRNACAARRSFCRNVRLHHC